MLSIEDYNHLKTLYEQFRKCNAYIKSLMEADDWDGVESAVREKNQVLKNIIFFEKPRLEEIKSHNELNGIRLELIELEKKNIEIVKSMKEKLAQEMTQVHKSNTLRNAYDIKDVEVISTLDVIDNE